MRASASWRGWRTGRAAGALAQDRRIVYLFHNPWIFGLAAKLDGFVLYPDGVIRLGAVKFR